MRKFFICAGLAVAGTASLQAAYAPDLNAMETSKMWSVSGTLRGFYDSNYNTTSVNKRGSYGFEVSPSLSLNVPLQQTELGLRYTYGLYYYQDRENLYGRPIDQTHKVDLWVSHAFTERWQTKIMDTLAIGQEPELLNNGTAKRIDGSNLHNNGAIALETQWTRLLGTELRYDNNLYHYQNGYYQGLLDQIGNSVALNANWRVQPTWLAFVGYKFQQINYTGNDLISGPSIPNTVPPGVTVNTYSDNRDNRSQFFYLGAQYLQLQNLSLVGRAGIQYIDYYNPAGGLSSTTTWSPYADISGTYTYLPGSYVQLGFTQTRNSTDVAIANGSGQTTLDQESSVIYAALNHRITPRITANVTGKIQYSTFNGGQYDGDSQTWYTLGLNLAYNFNRHVSAEVGYNYDDLTSDVPGQQYNRNRVYLGVTGTY